MGQREVLVRPANELGSDFEENVRKAGAFWAWEGALMEIKETNG